MHTSKRLCRTPFSPFSLPPPFLKTGRDFWHLHSKETIVMIWLIGFPCFSFKVLFFLGGGGKEYNNSVTYKTSPSVFYFITRLVAYIFIPYIAKVHTLDGSLGKYKKKREKTEKIDIIFFKIAALIFSTRLRLILCPMRIFLVGSIVTWD